MSYVSNNMEFADSKSGRLVSLNVVLPNSYPLYSKAATLLGISVVDQLPNKNVHNKPDQNIRLHLLVNYALLKLQLSRHNPQNFPNPFNYLSLLSLY